MFLEISQNSQENACARVSFLTKLQSWALQFYQKRDSGAGVFPVNFEYRIPPVAASVCCRKKVQAVKIEKLKGFFY